MKGRYARDELPETPPVIQPPGGIFGIDDVKFNQLVDEGRNLVAVVTNAVVIAKANGIVIETTLFGITLTNAIRLGRDSTEDKA